MRRQAGSCTYKCVCKSEAKKSYPHDVSGDITETSYRGQGQLEIRNWARQRIMRISICSLGAKTLQYMNSGMRFHHQYLDWQSETQQSTINWYSAALRQTPLP